MIKEEKLVLIGAPNLAGSEAVLENECVQHAFSRVKFRLKAEAR
jgi:hypothetical protein